MEVLNRILDNTDLWEVVLLIVIIYLLFKPDLVKRITKFKIGEFEVELGEIKQKIAESNEKISELESEIEYQKREFEDIQDFNANAPVEELASVRQSIRAQARNISDNDIFKQYLRKSASPEELFSTAVAIREKRPPALFPDIVNLLDELVKDTNLGGFRLNTVWTLTSSIHRILISVVKNGAKPFPTKEQLHKCKEVLQKLDKNPRVEMDRPDNPMRGIKGPIKHSLNWIEKARKIQET